jgi:hypothetical protein
VLAPAVYLIYLLLVRVVCEFLIVVFAMAEDLEEMRETIRSLNKTEQPASRP